MPVSSPPYKDVPVAGQVQVQMLSPRPLSLSVPQTSSYSVYRAPELITEHTHTASVDEHREASPQVCCFINIPASKLNFGNILKLFLND